MYLELKDKTQIEIREGANEISFCITVTEPQHAMAIIENLTEDNLSQFKYVEEEGLYSIITNKTLSKMQLEKEIDLETEENTGNYIATFYLKEVDTTAQKIKYLEETVDVLVLASLS